MLKNPLNTNREVIKRYLLLFLFVLASNWSMTQTYKFGDYMQFGRNELQKGNFTEAINYLNSAIRHRPASYEGWFLRGVAKYYLDDFYGAEQDFNESVKYDPYNSDIYHMRAIVRSRQYNFGGAMTDYAEAIRLNPKNSLFYLNRARTNLFLDSYDSAVADCNRAIRLKYKKEEVFLIRGVARMGQEQYGEALDDFDRAIRINPEKNDAYIQRGAVWMKLQLPDSAIADYNRAIDLNPDDSYAIFNRAMAFLEIKNNDAAYADLNRVLEISPYNSYAYYNRAIIYLGRGNYQQAMRDLDDVITLNPDNIVVYLFRGQVKMNMDDPQGAISDYSKAISIYPEFADAYYERSKARAQIGDLKGSDQDLEFAYAINEFNFSRADSLTLEQQMYLKRLVAFSGEFADKKTETGLSGADLNNIGMQPVYRQVLYSSRLEGVLFYDTYGKRGYQVQVITMTNRDDAVNTAQAAGELSRLTEAMPLPGTDEAGRFLEIANLSADLQDYSTALENYNKALLLDPGRIMAYLGRANTRLRIISLQTADLDPQYLLNPVNDYSTVYGTVPKPTGTPNYEEVIRDYNAVIDRDPGFYFAWFNRSVVKTILGDYWGAVSDLNRAIELKPDFPEAYFNKGLILIYLNLKTVGCRDISQAGEGGINSAYQILKRFCNQ